GGPEGDD
ncbi:hypothetical protein BN1723_020559, partial [Verticillium longisporum]